MDVFKTCMKIVKCHKLTFLVYLLLFLSLCAGMAILTKNPENIDFEQEKPPFALVNRDRETPLTRGMEEYLSRKGRKKELLRETRSLEDALFYGEAACIFIIPEGFSDQWEKGSQIPVEAARSQDTAAAAYLENAAEQYWNQISSLQAACPGYTQEKIAGRALELLSREIEVRVEEGGDRKASELYQAYVRLEGYTLMVLVILLVCQVRLAFCRPEIRMRGRVSPVRSSRFTGWLMLHGAAMSAAVWLILTLMGILIFSSQIERLDARLLLLLAAAGFCMMLVSLAVAELVAALVKNGAGDTLDMAANFIALGMGFLSGIFVPLELLGEGIQKAAQVTPTYWYALAVEKIFNLTSFEGEKLLPVWRCMGMMLAFAAALIAVAFLIAKARSGGEQSYAVSQTDRERG